MSRDKLNEEISQLDSIIGGKYLGNPSPVPANQMHIAYMWLENDISYALYEAPDEAAMFERKVWIRNLLEGSPFYSDIAREVNLDKAWKRAEVRKNFASALRNVKKGNALSNILGYAFSDEDLTNLAKLHKSNKYRKKIEDLLEDCNFHKECGLMSRKDYSRWIKEA